METSRKKYLWYTDTHLDRVNPITLLRFVSSINREHPNGVFITGDISNGLLLKQHLKFLAERIESKIYFVLGNHDYWMTGFQKQREEIANLCARYDNLVWTSETGCIELNEEVALFGIEGWYDATLGDERYLLTTLDWLFIEELRRCTDMKDRIEMFRMASEKSCKNAAEKLNNIFENNYKSIYALTHFPPWKEATRDEGTVLEKLWLPYNVNAMLGKTLEGMMRDRNKKHLTVLSGHTHEPRYIRVSRNIDCQVGEGHALFKVSPQVIYI